MKRHHIEIALLVFFLIVIRPSIDDINAIIEFRLDIASKISSISYPNLLLAPLVFFGAMFPDFDFVWWLRKFHRKLLHNVFAVFSTSAVLLLIGNTFYNGYLIAGAFLLGAFIHIAMDSITPTGTYLLWPFSKKFKIHWRVSTGTWEENVAMVVIVALIIGGYIGLIYLMASL
jgi:membrane-bound metal-dependent hydrolase YbcI (DUF457 family)